MANRLIGPSAIKVPVHAGCLKHFSHTEREAGRLISLLNKSLSFSFCLGGLSVLVLVCVQLKVSTLLYNAVTLLFVLFSCI